MSATDGTASFSPLDALLATAQANRAHFLTFLLDPAERPMCRVCGRTWSAIDDYARDTEPCPGYAQPCGAPAPAAEPTQ